MKKIAFAVVVALAIALVGTMAYFWLGRDPPGSTTLELSEPPLDMGLSNTVASEASEPVATNPEREIRSPSPPPIEQSAQAVAPAANNIGFRKELTSEDFSTYLIFMNLGDASETIDSAGTLKDRGSIMALQQEYELNEEEVEKLLRYSQSALQSDRENQVRQQDIVCNARDTFSTVNQFGEAINDYSGNVRKHQETLGRQAESELGPELFSKIISRVRSKPSLQVTAVDFPAMLAARGDGLEIEIERFCSHGR